MKEMRWVPKSHETDYLARVRPDILLAQLSDFAKIHAAELGFGYEAMKERGAFWVLLQMRAAIAKPLCIDKEYRLVTNPSHMKGIKAGRQFLVYQENELIVRADSTWAAVHAERKRPIPIPKLLGDEVETEALFDSNELPETKDLLPGEAIGQRTVGYTDLDLQNHMNNARYLSWCVDTIPLSSWDKGYPDFLDIRFKKESFYRDILEISRNFSDNIYRFDGKSIGDSDQTAREAFTLFCSFA
jgi:medium-chain acyl-[acyl-carrier-protein] hydrolase